MAEREDIVLGNVTITGVLDLTGGSVSGGAAATGSANLSSLSVSGATTLNGNVAIGNATGDLVGFHGATAVDQGAALTAQLTTITIADAAGTPDYAIQAVTATSPYGFASSQELISFMYVVKNLQTRVAELEQRLVEKGLVAAA